MTRHMAEPHDRWLNEALAASWWNGLFVGIVATSLEWVLGMAWWTLR